MLQALTPAYLKKGDLVALIAPSSFIENEQPFIEAEQFLTSIGLRSTRGQHATGQHGTYAGTDDQRLGDLQQAMDNPEVKAIWVVRGGYGAMRIMSSLNFRLFIKHPKWLIGFSDITAFHNLWAIYNIESIHGLMPVQLAKETSPSEESCQSLKDALFGHPLNYTLDPSKYNKTGQGQGQLVGGNLSLLSALQGSAYRLDTKGKILFLEDVREYNYQINRRLYSLKLAGVFDQLEGLIIGGFTDIKDGDVAFDQNYQEMILEVTHGKSYPILFDFPAGHITDNRALIFGRKVNLSVSEQRCQLDFS